MKKVDGKKLGQLIRIQANDEVSETETGVMSATAKFNCEWKDVLRLMPKRGLSRHPDFNKLRCVSAKANKGKGGLAEITAIYSGGSNSSDSGGGGDTRVKNPPVIEVLSTATDEPIETHPRFEDMAGTIAAPLWPDVFEEGRFAGFPREDENAAVCPFFGVESYLATRTVVRKTTITDTEPTISNVGKLEVPPKAGGGKRFLKTEHSYVEQGDVYTVTEEWLGPAEGGNWENTQIYQNA